MGWNKDGHNFSVRFYFKQALRVYISMVSSFGANDKILLTLSIELFLIFKNTIHRLLGWGKKKKDGVIGS